MDTNIGPKPPQALHPQHQGGLWGAQHPTELAELPLSQGTGGQGCGTPLQHSPVQCTRISQSLTKQVLLPFSMGRLKEEHFIQDL